MQRKSANTSLLGNFPAGLHARQAVGHPNMKAMLTAPFLQPCSSVLTVMEAVVGRVKKRGTEKLDWPLRPAT